MYPLLICDIFELIIGEPYKFQSIVDGLSFVLFTISTTSLVLFVYIMRLAILGGVIYYTQKQRKPKQKQLQGKGMEFDYSISKSAFFFQGYFFYHVLMQMIAQILMIVAIGAKIRFDNRHLFESSDTDSKDESVHVSPFLWYMLVGGYVLPVFGFFTFFIVTYFWVQEFPIGVCIDLLSLLRMPGMEHITNFTKNTKEHVDKMKRITKHVQLAELKTQFRDLHQMSWFKHKFLYPFKSPTLVILSIFYTVLQLGFFVCAYPLKLGSGHGPI